MTYGDLVPGDALYHAASGTLSIAIAVHRMKKQSTKITWFCIGRDKDRIFNDVFNNGTPLDLDFIVMFSDRFTA